MTDQQNHQYEWVVCKYGGTSVSQKSTWDVIVGRTKTLLQNQSKVCIVVSAVSQVTNHLEKLIVELKNEHAKLNTEIRRSNRPATVVPDKKAVQDTFQWIYDRHVEHCKNLQVPFDVVEPFLEEIQKLIEGIRLTGDSASTRLHAKMLSFGELMSSHIGVEVLKREMPGVNVKLIDARDVLIGSPNPNDNAPDNAADKYLNADVYPFRLDLGGVEDDEDMRSLSSQGVVDTRAALFANCEVVITQGFIASTCDGQTCVLGRGGSDTSGALMGAALGASCVEIWTDVDGMFSADPRHVKSAHIIEELSYREAQELAAMGAKVLHPRCLGPASWANIPVEIHNTMKPDQVHLTRIMSPECVTNSNVSTVMAIARRTGQVLVTISNFDMWGTSGFLSSVFEPFQRFGISVDLIATSQYAVSMTLDYIPDGVRGEPFVKLVRALRRCGHVDVQEDCVVVSIVGRKLRSMLHDMAPAFRELGKHNVLLLSESTEDLNLSFVLAKQDDVDAIVVELHNALLGNASPSPSVIPSTYSKLPPVMALPPSQSSVDAFYPPRAVVNQSLHDLKMRDPMTWWKAETIRYASKTNPYLLVDLATVSKLAPKLCVYSLRWSAHPAIIRTVYKHNPTVVFICRDQSDVNTVRSVVDIVETLRVLLPESATKDIVLPDGIALSPSNDQLEEECLTSNSILAEARILVANVLKVDQMSTIDVWFRNVVPHQKLHVLNNIPSTISSVAAKAPFEDIHEKLFEIVERGGETDVHELKQMVISGITGSVIDVTTSRPVEEIIRF